MIHRRNNKKRVGGFLSIWLLLLVQSPAVWADEIIGYIEEAFEAHVNDDFETAIKFYTKAIDSGKLPRENLAVAHNLRGEAWTDSGNCPNAILDFSKAIQLWPEYAHAFYFRSVCYQKTGKYKQAWLDIEKAIFFNPYKSLYIETRTLLASLMGKDSE